MMKETIKKITLLLLISISVAFPISAEDMETEDVDTPVIELTRDAYEIETNMTQTVPFTVHLEDAYTLSATSSDENVLVVDLVNGELIMTSKNPGTATITILAKMTDKEESHSAIVTVTVLPLTGTIQFERDTFYLIQGLYYDIEYEIEPSNINPSQVIWRSSNPQVATVVNGRVTGLRIGHTTITATLDDHVEVMELYVTVPLEKIEFNPSQVSIEVEKTMALPNLIYVPYDTTSSKSATYEVVDSEIVSLKDGVLEALKIGSTQVIAKVGDIETTLNVTVRPQSQVSDIQPLNLEVFDFENNDTLFFRVQDIESYTNRRYNLQLPTESVLSLIDGRDFSRLVIVLEDELMRNQFAYFNQMHLVKEIMEQLDTKNLQIDFVNEDMIPRIRFILSDAHDSGFDLNFTIREIGTNDSMYQHIKQTGAISISVSNAIHFDYQIGIHQDYTKAENNQLHFVYEFKNNTTHESQEAQEPDSDKLVMVNMTHSHMLISLRPMGKAQGTWIMYVLAVPVVIILGYVLWKLKQNVFKRS